MTDYVQRREQIRVQAERAAAEAERIEQMADERELLPDHPLRVQAKMTRQQEIFYWQQVIDLSKIIYGLDEPDPIPAP